MKRLLSLACLLSLSAVAPSLGADPVFQVKPGPETCANAHAVIVASRSGQHEYIWGEIMKIAKHKPYTFRVVDDYEPGVVQKLSFRQYDLKYHEGGTAYVVHCGHGGTCNAYARDFFESHNDWYSPEVFCGPVPEALINPQRP